MLAFTDAGTTTLAKGVICPDQAVFLGNKIPVVDTIAEIPGQPESSVVVVRGHGVLLRKSAGPGAEDMLTCLGLISQRLSSSTEANYLSSAQINELLDWDAEKHRQALDIKR
jgi:rhamnose utilization protein RhaD (predicted bifunctional aldolase and dehydrogenase)